MSALPELPEDSADLTMSQILSNTADELAIALSICVNVEEIIADRLLQVGGTTSSFVRTELQNVDRLIQMLGDIEKLTRALSEAGPDGPVNTGTLRGGLIMDELARRILSPVATRTSRESDQGSDVTFF